MQVKLRAIDYIFKLIGNYGYTSVKVSGNLKAIDLRSTVMLLVERQPLLRSRFGTVQNKYHGLEVFEAQEDALPIYEHTQHYDDFIEEKLKSWVISDNPYLWELHLVHSPTEDHHHLLFVSHHCIADGASNTNFLRCIYRLLEGLSCEDMLPKTEQFAGLSSEACFNYYPVRRSFSSVGRNAIKAKATQVLQKKRVFELTPAGDSTGVIRKEYIAFEQEDFADLLKAAKSKSITLTSLISAVIVDYLTANVRSTKPLSVDYVMAACPRSELGDDIGPLKNVLSNLALAVNKSIQVERKDNVDDIAQKIALSPSPRSIIEWDAREGGLQDFIMRKKALNRDDFTFPFIISNVGNIDYMNDDLQKYEIDDYYFSGTTPKSRSMGFRVNVAGIRQKLVASITWNDGELDNEFMQGLAETMRNKSCYLS